MAVGRAAVIAAWTWGLASFFVAPTSPITMWGRLIFYILLVAHTAECAIFFTKLKAAPGSLGENISKTMIFGAFHLNEINAPESS
jgi:uncharacterized protein YhhL (DUF1145 family)